MGKSVRSYTAEVKDVQKPRTKKSFQDEFQLYGVDGIGNAGLNHRSDVCSLRRLRRCGGQELDAQDRTFLPGQVLLHLWAVEVSRLRGQVHQRLPPLKHQAIQLKGKEAIRILLPLVVSLFVVNLLLLP